MIHTIIWLKYLLPVVMKYFLYLDDRRWDRRWWYHPGFNAWIKWNHRLPPRVKSHMQCMQWATVRYLERTGYQARYLWNLGHVQDCT